MRGNRLKFFHPNLRIPNTYVKAKLHQNGNGRVLKVGKPRLSDATSDFQNGLSGEFVWLEIKARKSIVMPLACHCPQQNVCVLPGRHLAMFWLQPNPRPPGSPPKIQGWACRRLLHWALHSSGLSLSLALSSNVDMHLAPSSKFHVSFNRLRPSPFSCAWQHWPRNHFQVANRLGRKSHSIPC